MNDTPRPEDRTAARAPVTVRYAGADDADEIAAMANAMNVDLGFEDGAYAPAQFLAAGLGGGAPFDVLVAERAGAVVGYAFFQPLYNSDLMGPGLFLNDLYVRPAARRAGVARRLLAELARIAVERGCVSVWWIVMENNARARALYDAIGARDPDLRMQELDGDALPRLAGEAVGIEP